MATRKRKTQKNAAKRRTPKARISAALKKYLGSLKKTNPAFKKAVAVRVKKAKTGGISITPVRNPKGSKKAWYVYSRGGFVGTVQASTKKAALRQVRGPRSRFIEFENLTVREA